MRLGVRSQKRTGIISILFAGILIWKYLTGNEHVKFYPWQDSQSLNISNICPSKTHGVLSKKWSCWSETNLRHGFGPIAFFPGRFPTSTFWKIAPRPFLWLRPKNLDPTPGGYESIPHKIANLGYPASTEFEVMILLHLGSGGPLGPGVWGKIPWTWMIWR